MSVKRKAKKMFLVQTIAGSERKGYKDGIGKEAEFNGPSGIVISRDGESLFIADYENRCIRKVSILDGMTSTIAGIPGIMKGIFFSAPSSFKKTHGHIFFDDDEKNIQECMDTKTVRFLKPNFNFLVESSLIKKITCLCPIVATFD